MIIQKNTTAIPETFSIVLMLWIVLIVVVSWAI
jgi:hypothetical protein